MRDAKIPRGETDSDVTSPRASQNADVSTLKFRGRIFRPDKGYRPRSLLELHIRTCIGAILNKREWWLKWSRDDGAIRIKWFTELEHEIITQTFEWSTREWSPSTLIECIPILYNGFPEDGSDEEKRAFVDKACAMIPYNLIWHSDWWEEMDEGGWDANAELFDQETPDEFEEANDKMESYGQIAWYFELVRFRKKMKELPLDAWEVPDDCPIGTEEAVAEATEFIIAVHDGEVTKESFEEYLPEGDHRPEILGALWVHVDRIIEELTEIRECITKTLEKVMDDHGLTNGDAVTEFTSPGPVDETWMSDLLITDALKKKFTEQVAVLENVPDDQKDWHPDSNNQVLDLVHPSLFCCVFGKTKGMAAAPTEGADVVERMQRMVFGASQLVENEHRGSAKYQWIPSDFAIARNGDVEILSYINNLHPLKHRGLYDSIREIFKAFVPLFDRVLSCLLEPEGPLPTMGSGDLFNRDMHEIPNHPSIPELFDIGSSPSSFTLRGKKFQVIVKIAEIRLTPENPSYPGGAWHVEGSDAEQIVSTGIYYFGCDNITVSKLAFRVIVNEPNYQQDDSLGMQAVYGLQRGERLVQALGTVTATENRCVVFPNTLQHQVEPFELEDKTRPGVRKILAFFIVDPSKLIPSTSVIPPQQATWLGHGQDTVLHDLSKLKTLPDGVVNKSVKELLGDGMALEQAKAHRVGLMAERKPADDDRAAHELFFSLCEH